MAIQNIQTGNFVNADSNYYAAPQHLNAQGQIIGHSHVVIEQLSAIDQTTLPDPNKFAFFKGVNDPAVNGVLSADVSNGLPAGVYKLSSINAAANHQPVLVAIAQHGSLDDAVYVSVFIVQNKPDLTLLVDSSLLQMTVRFLLVLLVLVLPVPVLVRPRAALVLVPMPVVLLLVLRQVMLLLPPPVRVVPSQLVTEVRLPLPPLLVRVRPLLLPLVRVLPLLLPLVRVLPPPLAGLVVQRVPKEPRLLPRPPLPLVKAVPPAQKVATTTQVAALARDLALKEGTENVHCFFLLMIR
jgi:hypothetical protein